MGKLRDIEDSIAARGTTVQRLAKPEAPQDPPPRMPVAWQLALPPLALASLVAGAACWSAYERAYDLAERTTAGSAGVATLALAEAAFVAGAFGLLIGRLAGWPGGKAGPWTLLGLVPAAGLVMGLGTLLRDDPGRVAEALAAAAAAALLLERAAAYFSAQTRT